MKRGGISFRTIMLILALVVLVVVMMIVFNPKLLDLAKGATTYGCPIGQEVRYECPCEGVRVSSGYCCEEGPSNQPCT